MKVKCFNGLGRVFTFATIFYFSVGPFFSEYEQSDDKFR